ncbi:MAG: alpha/beta hydrolase [Candidatus Zipacnadales bacterium]
MRLATLVTFWLLAAVTPADHLLLQVENFSGPWRRQTNIAGYLNSGFCISNANPAIAATTRHTAVHLTQPGRYAVWVRAYTSENSRRAIQVEVAGELLRVTHRGTKRRWVWEWAGDVELRAGEVQVIVHDAEDGFESVDAVLITNREGFDPMIDELKWTVYEGEPPSEADALRFNIEACCAQARGRTDPKSAGDWQQRRSVLRRKLLRALGLEPLPPCTPLNARVTGRVERERYIIENIVFESRPRFYVTANLYLPKHVELPAPAIVVVPGHAMREGKNYEPYQRAQIGLARKGFVVLAYDPIGQGERELPGFGHHLGYSLLLVGQTNEGLITWDTIRAIDYLCTRPEVDQERIGLTGNSGGGENTFYVTPLDRRIKAAASFCFVCSYDQWIRHGGNHCICNHLPGIVREMEQFEILGLNAPRPFLAGNGAQDPIFPIAGTRETLRRARQVYALCGAANAVCGVEAPLPHGWAPPLREAAYGFFAYHLQGQGTGEPIPEEAYEAAPYNAPELLCFNGKGFPENRETLVTLARRKGEDMIARYDTSPKTSAEWRKRAARLRRDLWRVLGGKPQAGKPTARLIGSFQNNGHIVERLALVTEPGMEVPALLMHPKDPPRPCPATVIIDEAGKSIVARSEAVELLLADGIIVLALDPRGLGEVSAAGKSGDYNQVASDAIVLGRPLLGQQAWDVIQAAEYLAQVQMVNRKRISVRANGPAGLIALLAAALSERFSEVTITGTIPSFLYAIEDTQPQPRWIFVPNLLKVADIPQLAALVAPRPLTFTHAVGYGQQLLAPHLAEDKLRFTRTVYEVLSSSAPGTLPHFVTRE